MGRQTTPMTRQQAIEILAYDIADLISRNDGYDGLIPDDRLAQDELVTVLPDLLRRLGIEPTAPAAPEPTFHRHTCNTRRPGQALPFGRKAPEGECVRCDELRAGAETRSAPAWVDDARRREEHARQDEAASRAHFAPNGPHARGVCGPVCTFGQW